MRFPRALALVLSLGLCPALLASPAPLTAQDVGAQDAGTPPRPAPAAALPAPQLEGADDSEPKTSSEGYYKLAWAPPENAVDPNASDAAEGALQFEVQESADGAFSAPRVIYRGADLATTLSGRSTGNYYYRVRAIRPTDDAADNDLAASAWSRTLEVRVQHHSLEAAFAFFFAGFAVFAFIAGLILTGYFMEKREERAKGR